VDVEAQRMINRIYTYLAIAATILLALFGIHRSGKQSGKAQKQSEHDKQEIQRQEAQINEVTRQQKIVNDTAKLTSDDIDERLRRGGF
jgi:hypothetical protein